MKLWDAFIEDYEKEIPSWSLRYILEVYWHFCQDGGKAVLEFIESEGEREKNNETRTA